MPKVIFLPNEEFCPEGMVVDAAAGDNLLEVAHNAGVEIHHAWLLRLHHMPCGGA